MNFDIIERLCEPGQKVAIVEIKDAGASPFIMMDEKGEKVLYINIASPLFLDGSPEARFGIAHYLLTELSGFGRPVEEAVMVLLARAGRRPREPVRGRSHAEAESPEKQWEGMGEKDRIMQELDDLENL